MGQSIVSVGADLDKDKNPSSQFSALCSWPLGNSSQDSSDSSIAVFCLVPYPFQLVFL